MKCKSYAPDVLNPVTDDLHICTTCLGSGRYHPKSTIFALLSDQGTACAETALCNVCFNLSDDAGQSYKGKIESQQSNDVVPDSWADCTDNDALSCNVCGITF